MIIKNFLYKYLLSTKKKIFIYGTGKIGLKTFNLCKKLKIDIYGFVISNENKNLNFMNYKIYKLNEITNFDNKIILLSFAVKKSFDINYILNLNTKCEMYYLYVSPFDNIFFDENYFSKNENNFLNLYNILSDDHSKKTLINLINFRITGKIKYLSSVFSNKIYNDKNLLNLNHDETFVDIGAYKGDTIKEFLNITNNQYKKIYAFECDKKNFLKLEKNTCILDNIKNYNLAIFNKKSKVYISGEASMNTHIINYNNDIFIENKYYEINSNKLDNLIFDKVTYIKYDIEGAEIPAIIGSKNIINKYLPKLCISLYHKSNDIFNIPIIINKLFKKYKFYIRQIPHIPCWDTMLYCIPEK